MERLRTLDIVQEMPDSIKIGWLGSYKDDMDVADGFGTCHVDIVHVASGASSIRWYEKDDKDKITYWEKV